MWDWRKLIFFKLIYRWKYGIDYREYRLLFLKLRAKHYITSAEARLHSPAVLVKAWVCVLVFNCTGSKTWLQSMLLSAIVTKVQLKQVSDFNFWLQSSYMKCLNDYLSIQQSLISFFFICKKVFTKSHIFKEQTVLTFFVKNKKIIVSNVVTDIMFRLWHLFNFLSNYINNNYPNVLGAVSK